MAALERTVQPKKLEAESAISAQLSETAEPEDKQLRRLESLYNSAASIFGTDHVLATPILAHASNGNSFFKDSAWRGSPWAWRRVLEEHSDLRLCFGHFGHLEGMDGFTMPLRCVAWAEGFLRLILEYENVYADLSNTPCADADQTARDEYQKRFLYWLCGRLARSNGSEGVKLAQRLIYGSDWWMGMLSGTASQFLANVEQMVDGAMKPAADALSSHGIVFKDAFMGDNALRFLGVRNDAGAVEVASGNGSRLRGFYEATHRAAGNSEVVYPRWLVG